MRVAVIGAGAAGLVTARELLREGLEPVVFEAAPQPGGTWIYDPHEGRDPLGRDPEHRRIHSPLYASLRTNLPRDLMAFDDLAFGDQGGGDPRRFPGHAEVLRYLLAFCRAWQLGPRIRTGAVVTRVRPMDERGGRWVAGAGRPPSRWLVRLSEAGVEHEDRFDAVAVCNGHYHQPRVPALPGLDRFAGRVLHSQAYRQPQGFAGLTVALLGAKSSGIDLSRELATVARRVILCARDLPRADGLGPGGNLDQRPSIVAVQPEGLVLSDGTHERGVDALVLCTGYHYVFGFLEPDSGLLEERVDRVFPLYLELMAAHAPSLALVGLPFAVVPFPLFERQARLWARVLARRVTLPDAGERLAIAHHREARFAAAGVAARHRLRYGEAQFRYGAGLAALAGDPAPPRWRELLYAAVGRARREDPWGYRDAELPTIGELLG